LVEQASLPLFLVFARLGKFLLSAVFFNNNPPLAAKDVNRKEVRSTVWVKRRPAC